VSGLRTAFLDSTLYSLFLACLSGCHPHPLLVVVCVDSAWRGCMDIPKQNDASFPRSLPEFRFNKRFYPFNAFRSLLGIAGDAAAPTYAELYSGEWQHAKCSGCG